MSSPAARVDRAGDGSFASFQPAADREDRDLFDGGPPIGLQMRLGLLAPGRPNRQRRAVIAFGLGWLVPFLISLIQGAVLHDTSFTSFAGDYGMYARSAFAAPLLLLAEGVCFPRLSDIVLHFRDGGLIRSADDPRYRAALRSTRALRDSMRLEIVLLAIGIALVVALNWTIPETAYQAWHRWPGTSSYSPAGWWNALVSVPILIMLLLGWLWRVMLWTRFLWLMSRLDLKIIPAHPDGAGGMAFIGLSVQIFSVLACCCGIVVAGSLVNRIAHGGGSILAYHMVVLGFAAVMVMLFAGPVLVFSPKLLEARRQGILEYGSLARRVGVRMEQKWIGPASAVDDGALSAPDFSATTDLYSIVANAYAMNIFPVALVSLGLLIGGALVPFIPAVLMSMSPEAILDKLTSLFL
jgi:hypothetical protein